MKDELTYKKAGVDTEEGRRAVNLMKEHARKTFNPDVLTGLGGFGSLFRLDTGGMKEPVLVSGADGVGTKLKIAFMTDRHDTIGRDCVAMCVNDVICQGAKPLFFLDYIATGKLQAEKAADIVRGIAAGCVDAECALAGGETAEMPGFYRDGEYDIAGFAVGIVDRSRIVDGRSIREGDAIIGISSGGLHSNGYSLVRKLFFERLGLRVEDFVAELDATVGEALLAPTRIYVKACAAVISEVSVKGIAHITGGGFFENIPRIMPEGLGARVERGSWEIPPLFGYIQERGGVSDREMFGTFNMGVGMVMVVAEEDADKTVELLGRAGEQAARIGEAAVGEGVFL